MDVVPTGVHKLVRCGEGRARLLLDGQGVELGPHSDGFPLRADPGQAPRVDDVLHFFGIEGFRDEPGGNVFSVARLGARVQPLAQLDGPRKLLFQRMDQRPE
jgi:hypothetical protein